jgi:hypothetical protein
MKTRLISVPLLTELGLILSAQVYKQVAPNPERLRGCASGLFKSAS